MNSPKRLTRVYVDIPTKVAWLRVMCIYNINIYIYIIMLYKYIELF